MTYSRTLILAVAVTSALAFGQTKPKPRVMVILDTSKSMLEPTNSDNPLYPMNVVGGDWDPVTNPVCLNKFCTAKKVVSTVIPQFTTEARIGLASYYQFVLTVDRPDDQSTKCLYDVLSPPGQVRQFSSLIDFTGNGTAAVCPAGATSGACPAGTRETSFPDGFNVLGGGARLDQACNTPAGYVRPANIPNAGAVTCAGTGCYLLTKTAFTTGVPATCDLTINPNAFPALPATLNNTQCPGAAGVYTTQQSRSLLPAMGGPWYRRFVAVGAPDCGGPAEMATTTPANPAAFNFTALPATGTGVGQWQSTAGLNCRVGAACSLFLESATPLSQDTGRAWYGFHDATFMPAGGFTSLASTVPASYPFSSRTGSSGYTAPVLTGTVTQPSATPCLGGPVGTVTRYSANQTLTGTFGIANPAGALAGHAIHGLMGRVDETPTRVPATSNYQCTPGWPCDVTLANDVANPPVWTFNRTLYNPALLTPPTERFQGAATAGTPSGTNTYTLRIISPSVTMCPAIGTTAVNPNPANTAWTSATPTGCPANGPCAFSAPTQTVATAPVGECPASIQKYNSAGIPTSVSGVSPVNTCNFNGKTYTSTPVNTDSGGNAYRANFVIPATSACTPGTTNVNNLSTFMSNISRTHNLAPGTINATYPAALTYLSEAPAGTTNGTGFNLLVPPGGYSGAPTGAADHLGSVLPAAPAAGSISDPTGGCLGAVGAEVQVNSALCNSGAARGLPCTMRVVGPEVVSNNCGAAELNKPCYVCRYQPRQFTWTRSTKTCTYSATRYDFVVDRTTPACAYNRPYWNTEVQQPTTRVCTYQVGARRYEFNQPSTSWCEYFAVRTVLESPRTLYTYQYLTKGTEPIGRAESGSVVGNLCTSPWATGNSFETACPETVAGCGGMTPLTGALTTPGIPAGSTCKLRAGGAPGINVARAVNGGGSNIGRYLNYQNISHNFMALNDQHQACEAANVAASPDTYKNVSAAPPTPAGFCMPTGSPATQTRKLISDFYDPTVTNTLATLYPMAPPFIASWNNTATKAQGFGAENVAPTPGTGDLPNRSMFVPIPDDPPGPYDANTQRLAIEAAVGKCIPPSVTPPGPNGRLAGGACVADERIAPFGPTGDFTPLYGSLKSTFDYLDARYDTDPEKLCREYFIVLATDGLENTPKNYAIGGNDPNLTVEGLVGSFRNHADNTKPRVNTFVIAMGSGAAGSPLLTDVAGAGGTTQAYQATNLAQLQTALQAVFTTITQGVYSYSRPAIGTDGNRLYTGQHIRYGSTPDWSGIFTAYKVNPVDGTFTIAWEMGGKLNDPAHPARNIYAGWDRQKVAPFTGGSADVVDRLDNDFDAATIGAGLTSNDVITFLRGRGNNYLGSATTRSSKLGPLQYSAPVVVGKSPYDPDYGGLTTSQKNAFSTFKTTVADTRQVRVLVAGNDGMVHAALEGSTAAACTAIGESDPTCPSGREDWAFIPGSLKGNMTLTGQRPLIESLHRLVLGNWQADYLDNTVAIADVCGNAAGEAENCAAGDWKTIAIMTQRKGGRGVGAIDITSSAPSTDSKYLWDYEDGDLGGTMSIPAVGRVLESGHERFVAIFGGGIDDVNTASLEGRRMYVLNAVTGAEIREFSKFDRGSSYDVDLVRTVLPRPALYRRPGPNYAFINSAFMPAGETLYAMRFARADGSMQDDPSRWKPDELFDPTSLRNLDRATCGSPPCPVVKVRKVYESVAGNPTAMPPVPPKYALADVQDLPLGPPNPMPPPIWNRPKLAPSLVASGAQIDLYVGTGDTLSPRNPGSEFVDGNYFYAVHDFNQQPRGPQNDGRALWIAKFPARSVPAPNPADPVVNKYEQVVSEPAVISGCVVVATYTTPDLLTPGSCNAEGDTTLYGFDPITGDLRDCLTYIAPSPYAGQQTSVVKMGNVGIPSDLVVINDNIYLSTSAGGLQRAPVKAPPKPGAVRSFRRIK